MQTRFLWSRASVMGLTLVSLSLGGCPQPQSFTESPRDHKATISVRQPASTAAVIPTSTPQAITYSVCGEIPDWERLSLEAQTAALMDNPRYGDALTTDPLQSLFEKFWHESLITFTTYGLSARTEPIYLSGVWTGIEEMSACYEGDRPTAINAGEVAEIWLIGYQVVDFTWSGETYQLTVEPTSTGLRFLQFERVEGNGTLPIVVLESTGHELTVASGDW